MMKPFEKPIYVTRPFLPPLEEFCEGLKEIWESRWLTNDGPILRRFTQGVVQLLRDRQSVSVQQRHPGAADRAAGDGDLRERSSRPPITFVATTHALFWNKIRPVFVDIEPDYYTLDPEKVEAAITPWTTAILAVHVYGHPCKLNALGRHCPAAQSEAHL